MISLDQYRTERYSNGCMAPSADLGISRRRRRGASTRRCLLLVKCTSPEFGAVRSLRKQRPPADTSGQTTDASYGKRGVTSTLLLGAMPAREVETSPWSDGPLDESESRRVVRQTPRVSDLAWSSSSTVGGTVGTYGTYGTCVPYTHTLICGACSTVLPGRCATPRDTHGRC